MKIYSMTFDARKPSDKKIWVPPYSDYKIGVNVINAVQPYSAQEVRLFLGDTEVQTDGGVQEFTTFVRQSGASGQDEYVVKAYKYLNEEDDDEADAGEEEETEPVLAASFRLTVITTDSTVFDIDEKGGGSLHNVGLGIVKSPSGTISIDRNIVPTYDGTTIKLGDDAEYDLSETPTYSSEGEAQTLTLGDTAYTTTELAGEYEDGTTFSFTVLASS